MLQDTNLFSDSGKDQPNSLFWVAAKCSRRSFASVIVPRLCFTGFNFSQPFLLQRVLSYLTGDGPSNRPDVGVALIFAYILVYYGYALSGALNQHRVYRAVANIRGSLIALIYRETLAMSVAEQKESEVVTLMNADVERIATGLRQSQELWASLLEIPLSVWLLSRQISWAALAPLGVILICTSGALGSAPKLISSQKSWLERIQARVNMTTTMISLAKPVKMTALTPRLEKNITELREREVENSGVFRRMLVTITTFCKFRSAFHLHSGLCLRLIDDLTAFASTSLSPVVAFGTYIAMTKYYDYPTLTSDRALTSLVLMNLLFEPVSFFITALSGLTGAMGCFERIRQYLNTETKRKQQQPSGLDSLCTPSEPPYPPRDSRKRSSDEVEKGTMSSSSTNQLEAGEAVKDDSSSNCVVMATKARCGWDEAMPPILEGLDFRVKKGSLTMVVGPVSSGKSTLLNAILGETSLCEGLSRSSTSTIAYCSQSPWLVNDTVEYNVTQGYDMVRKWYDSVLTACDLSTDLAIMPMGDKTLVGTRGLSLSGGQQQRLVSAKDLKPLGRPRCCGIH